MVAALSDDSDIRSQAESMQRIYSESNVAQNLKLETAIVRYSTLCNNINNFFSSFIQSAVGIGETIKKMTNLCDESNKMLEERNKNKGVKSKYADDPSCLSLSFHEFLCRLNPDERNILMTTDSEKKAMDIVKAHTVM